jgi:hypothetical protein
VAAVDAAVQEAYSAIQKSFIEEGRAPHYTELAGLLAVDVEEARRLQREALTAGVGAWPLSDTDYVESFAPFYNGPTNVRVSVDGEQKWNAQCGLESLAVRWVFPGKEVRLDALCLDCGEPIVMRFLDEEILEVTPESTVGFMNQSFNSEISGDMTDSYF